MTKGKTHADKANTSTNTKAHRTTSTSAKGASGTTKVRGPRVKSELGNHAGTRTRSSVSRTPSSRTRKVQEAGTEPSVVNANGPKDTGPNRVTIKLGTLLGVLGIALLGLYGVIMSILVLARYW